MRNFGFKLIRNAFAILAVMSVLGLISPSIAAGWATSSAPIYNSGNLQKTPPVVGFEGFKVYAAGKEVIVEWSMGETFDNLGFNLYREVGGIRELINKTPIAGSSLKSLVNLRSSGENYSWSDGSLKPGAAYYIEEIFMNGNTELHGPVFPEMKRVFRRSAIKSRRQNSPLLTELTKSIHPSVQKEFSPVNLSSEKLKRSPEKQRASSVGEESTQWEIAGQYAPKISVKDEGWYRIPSIDLNSVKFDTGTDRTKWQLYTGGEQVPIRVNNDGSIEFYGRGLDTPTADERIYYLIEGANAGLRVTQAAGGSAGSNQVAPSFDYSVERKARDSYVSSIFNGDAENWFGPLITSSVQTVQDLNVDKIASAGQATLRVKIQGLTAVGHQINVTLNDSDLGLVTLNGHENRSFDFDVSTGFLNEGTNQVKLQSVGLTNDICLVDSVRLTYPRRYEAVDEKLRFSVPAGQAARFGGFVESEISLYEINSIGSADREVTAAVEGSGGNRTYSLAPANYDREMLAVADSRPEQVSSIIRNQPTSWNQPANRADFVIIVPFRFYKYAEGIAFYRRNQGLETKVILIEDLFDEFSFGVHTPDAVRRFFERATTSWSVKPRYALLFGDSSFDPRNYLGLANRDLIPTKLIDTQFLETSSDAWLADFDNDGIENIALGRLPVSDEIEADAVYEKWIRYERQATRSVRSNVMIADTGFEPYNNLLSTQLPGNVQLTKIERANMTDSEMHLGIMNSLNANPEVVTYTGHGTTGIWAHSNVFAQADAVGLQNNQLSLYLLMTCLNGYTHGAYNSSIAEELLKSPRGGGALVWASSGTTFPNTQFEMTQTITDEIFNASPDARIGDMIIAAKNATLDMDVRTTWQLNGDPTAVIR